MAVEAGREQRFRVAKPVLPPWFSRVAAIVVIAVAILFPLFFPKGDSWVNVATLAAAYCVMALGLNVMVGFAGLLDLGYVAFFAIGAYCTGWFSSGFFANANVHLFVSKFQDSLPGIHLNWLIVVVIAMGLCALAGIIIGLPTLRLRGDYIAIVTLAFGEIISVFAINCDSLHIAGGGATLTAGRQGITPVDGISYTGGQPFNQLDLRPWYWTALGMVLIVIFCNIRLRDSRLGRAWIAIREDEVAAASMGVPLVRTKLSAYATGAAFGGAAGAFLGSFLNTVNADQFAFAFSIFVLAMIILGGIGSIWGVVVGAVTLTYINYKLIPDQLNGVPGKLGLHFQLADLSFGIFGFLLVIMMVLRPEGLIPERRRQLELEEGVGVDDQMVKVQA
jgi:branched-chain amino acid transport system permease protein